MILPLQHGLEHPQYLNAHELIAPVLYFPNRSRAVVAMSVLQHDLLRVSRMALSRTVRALEPCALGQLVQRLLSYNVAAGHHHWWICVSCLLFTDWTDEDRVEVVCAWQWDLDG